MTGELAHDPELWFHTLATHYVEVQALYHLNQAGVFQLLDSAGPLDGPTLAARLRVEPRVLEALLDYVVGVDRLIVRDSAGNYALTEPGRRILERFGRREKATAHFNLFDVRAGAYGPVWTGLDKLLSGGVYGRDVKRVGEVAADAVYKLVVRLEPKLRQIVEASRSRAVVELGVSTGLLERLGADNPELALCGVDRSADALARAARRAAEAGVSSATWLEGDVFDPDAWIPRLPAGPGLLFSVHFHEFMAAPDARVRLSRALSRLAERLPGWQVVAFEQPLQPATAREQLSPVLWLYAQSNVLIHHLIGNGRILDEQEWIDVFQRGGCAIGRPEPVGYLGYLAFLARFSEQPAVLAPVAVR